MNFGRSFIAFGSTATVTTGSKICWISSNGVIPLVETVSPTVISLIPEIPTMFPATADCLLVILAGLAAYFVTWYYFGCGWGFSCCNAGLSVESGCS